MEPKDFSEIRLAGCERGSDPHRTPAHGEWEASFSFLLSSEPDEEWINLFKDVLDEQRFDHLKWRFPSRRIKKGVITLHCHPDQLQRFADLLKGAIERANHYRRDMLAAGEQLTERRRKFERQIQAALDSLQL